MCLNLLMIVNLIQCTRGCCLTTPRYDMAFGFTGKKNSKCCVARFISLFKIVIILVLLMK